MSDLNEKQYEHIAEIYELGTGDDLRARIETCQKEAKLNDYTNAFEFYLSRNRVPVRHAAFILGYNRRLTEPEVAVLDLDRKLKQEGEKGIAAVLEGLNVDSVVE